ncbi:MAG: hypothetical protein M3N57_06960 [Actinomycetota bacterium]|nr:hypothetical protein [Actinomycetota bacterium]
MNEEPRPPLFLDEHGDIDAYLTVAEMASDVETVDVLNNEYEAFDAEGNVLTLHATDWRSPVSITLDSTAPSPPDEDSTAPSQPDELARRLRAHVDRVGLERFDLEVPPEHASLGQLVRAVARFHIR